MQTIEISAGPIEYLDTGGEGPIFVMTPGLMMDETLWSGVVGRLTPDHRCIIPRLPLGGHRQPMPPDADLSLHALADLLGDLLDQLDLQEVILVSVDWGGPQLTAVHHPDRLAGLVLLPQEAFDNIPPGLPGKFAKLAGRAPGGLLLAAHSLRFPLFARLPVTFGWMAKRPIPKQTLMSWTTGARTDRAIRRDIAKYVRTSDYDGLNEAARLLAAFDRPTLVLWASEERVMPVAHGRKLAAIIPGARYEEIDDCFTLMPLDRPDVVADRLAAFAVEVHDRAR